eukprot:scaffold36811_cov63-Phaeocystis_antarctica.AAC.2
MSALSLALRHSACQSERNGSGPQKVAGSNPNATSEGIYCSHLPHVHPRQPRLDRKEVVVVAVLSVHQRPLKGLLLLRAHHHVERCAADLGVVDLFDAVGALERLRVVPRLQQQHRVPDGSDAVAEQRQVGLHVGLPDHVVAHPEERVLVPQPLLREEVGERVEQRGDRRVEEPARKDGGLAHVRRPLRLQPLAHGQLVLLFRAGDVELVDVAVFHDVLGERLLAQLHHLGVDLLHLGVNLLHRVARQLRQQLAHAGQRHAQPQVLGQRGPLGEPLCRAGTHAKAPLHASTRPRCNGTMWSCVALNVPRREKLGRGQRVAVMQLGWQQLVRQLRCSSVLPRWTGRSVPPGYRCIPCAPKPTKILAPSRSGCCRIGYSE